MSIITWAIKYPHFLYCMPLACWLQTHCEEEADFSSQHPSSHPGIPLCSRQGLEVSRQCLGRPSGEPAGRRVWPLRPPATFLCLTGGGRAGGPCWGYAGPLSLLQTGTSSNAKQIRLPKGFFPFLFSFFFFFFFSLPGLITVCSCFLSAGYICKKVWEFIF